MQSYLLEKFSRNSSNNFISDAEMSKNQEERQTSQCQLKQAEDDDIIWAW